MAKYSHDDTTTNQLICMGIETEGEAGAKGYKIHTSQNPKKAVTPLKLVLQVHLSVLQCIKFYYISHKCTIF